VEDEPWILTLTDEHDLATRDAVRARLREMVAAGPAVVVDLSDATFVESTILNELIVAHERARDLLAGRFAIVSPSGSAAGRLFDLVGVDRVLHVFESRAEAIEWCGYCKSSGGSALGPSG